MVIRKCAVLLVVLLARMGCASSSSATPSPFEGIWLAIEYISPGKLSGTFSDYALTQLFKGNRISRASVVGGGGAYIFMDDKFTFTDTEIKVKKKGGEYIIRYTLNEGGLITEDDDLGKILWAK
jgi:hypothetical protein